MNLESTNGLKILSAMKQSIDLARIPFVFLTGTVNENNIQKGFLIGADECLKKPINLSDIKKQVEHILKKKNKFNHNPIKALFFGNGPVLNDMVKWIKDDGNETILLNSMNDLDKVIANNNIDIFIFDKESEKNITKRLIDLRDIDAFFTSVMILESTDTQSKIIAQEDGVDDFIYSDYKTIYRRGKLFQILDTIKEKQLNTTYSIKQKKPRVLLQSCEKNAFTGSISFNSTQGFGMIEMKKGEYMKISFNDNNELKALELIESLNEGEMVVRQYTFFIN
jgi:DNA-binding NtrC family response regulator